MRLVDADSLYKGIEQQECNACESYNNVKCAACDIADCLRWIDDAPTIEYVTHEQFCNAVNDFFNEFKENGADEETLAKCIFIGLAFSNLERRLFLSKDGGTNEKP